METDLFSQNIKAFKDAFGASRYSKLDEAYIRDRRANANPSRDLAEWKESIEKYIIMPDLIPRDPRLLQYYNELSKDYVIGNSIDQYLNDHECDPHLFAALNIIYESIEECGFNPSINLTTDTFNLTNLIVLDPGNGVALQELISNYQPTNILLCVNRWEDFVLSFDAIDWQNLQAKLNSKDNPIGLYLSRVNDANEILTYISYRNLISLDHSLLFFPCDASSKTKEILKELSSRLTHNMINYLGFVQDEYNMVMTSSKKMSYGCTVYKPPSPALQKFGKVVVCASGPSLDKSFEDLLTLQEDHFICASASSYGSLRRHGVRVDLVCILERGYSVFNDYRQIIEECGRDDAILITSSVSDYRLHNLFSQVVVFFRPSLTPFALFSEHYDEHLPLDGPQAVNALVSFLVRFKPISLLLVGVDLGSRTLDKIRSQEALGVSPRVLDIKKQANLELCGEAYTDQYMSDACMVLEIIGKSVCNTTALYNISDGIFIDHFDPVHSLADYTAKSYDEKNHISITQTKTVFELWLKTCRYSSVEHFKAIWQRGGQRTSIYQTIHRLRQVLASNNGRITYNEYLEINNIFSVAKLARMQFAPRILRGCFLKTFAAIYRQDIVMAAQSECQQLFADKIRSRLNKFSIQIEHEMYELCDKVESTCFDCGTNLAPYV